MTISPDEPRLQIIWFGILLFLFLWHTAFGVSGVLGIIDLIWGDPAEEPDRSPLRGRCRPDSGCRGLYPSSDAVRQLCGAGPVSGRGLPAGGKPDGHRTVELLEAGEHKTKIRTRKDPDTYG